MNLKYYFYIFIFGLVGCQTPRVTVVSSPNAEVVTYDMDSKQLVSLGTTPLELDEDQLEDAGALKDDGVISLRLQKDGYNPENVLIDFGNNPIYKVGIDLTKSHVQNAVSGRAGGGPKGIDPRELHGMVGEIQFANRLMSSGKHQQAFEVMDRLTVRFPKVAYFWDMRGSLAFLLKRKQDAIHSYERSLALFSDNVKTRRMLAKIQGE